MCRFCRSQVVLLTWLLKSSAKHGLGYPAKDEACTRIRLATWHVALRCSPSRPLAYLKLDETSYNMQKKTAP
jgi:hypothetical protein